MSVTPSQNKSPTADEVGPANETPLLRDKDDPLAQKALAASDFPLCLANAHLVIVAMNAGRGSARTHRAGHCSGTQGTPTPQNPGARIAPWPVGLPSPALARAAQRRAPRQPAERAVRVQVAFTGHPAMSRHPAAQRAASPETFAVALGLDSLNCARYEHTFAMGIG
jgi:hypothetical protein